MPDPSELRDVRMTRREMAAAAAAHIENAGLKVESIDWLNTADEWSATGLRSFVAEITEPLLRAANLIEGAVGDAEKAPREVFAAARQEDDDA